MLCGMWVCFAEGADGIGQMWVSEGGEDWSGDLVYLVSVGH